MKLRKKILVDYETFIYKLRSVVTDSDEYARKTEL